MEASLEELWRCEIGLLRGDKLEELPDVSPWIKHIQSGDYVEIVESDVCTKIFADYKCDQVEGEGAVEKLCRCLNDHLLTHSSPLDRFEVLLFGIASLQGFIQTNWTGPKYRPRDKSEPCINPFLLKYLPEEILEKKDIKECIRLCLSVDGEEISCTIEQGELLLLAEVCFRCCLPDVQSANWWLLRSLYIHQQILEEHAPTLKNELMSLSEELEGKQWLEENAYLNVLFRLELARIHLHYGKVLLSEQEIKKVLGLLNMEVTLKGAMGKRTQHQRKEVAQLMIDVKIDRVSEEKSQVPEQQFLKDVLLNDDVRLPQVVFTNAGDGQFPDLEPLEQAALVALFGQKKKSQAKDHLQNEELLPFLNCVLSHKKVWILELSALLFRSRIECEHKRTVERALFQTQELTHLEDNTTPLPLRLNLFYCSYAPPWFIIASECASIIVSIGSMQSALDIFLRLQMWDEVIACYNYLKLRHKAAEVIREQMKKGETVKLWCYLGDATDDVSCYERAWELSERRSAQAQRHWGMHYFQRKMFKNSIPHFKQSLAINSLQVSLWFRLGYAALVEQEIEESATAYRRYCALEPDSFEAWNNLAKAYTFLGQKERAYNALQEAIKCNFEMWQVWDNLMAVSSDCGDFEEVIRCYHRILDLKDKHIDEQILTVLVSVIVKGIKDCKNRPSTIHRKRALELFGRITSKLMGNPIIWQLYADLTASIEEQTSITRSKTVQYYQKAYTAAMQDPTWFKDMKNIRKVLEIGEFLAEAHFEVVKNSPSTNESLHSLTSAKISLENILAKVKNYVGDLGAPNVNEDFKKDLSSLESTLDNVKAQIDKLQ